jgi:hypothetical protein
MILVAAITSCTGCAWLGDVIEPGYLINESGRTVTVSVSKPRNGGVCPLAHGEPIHIAPARAAYEHRSDGWRAAALSAYDADTCAATISLPADSALMMFMNGSCSDDAERLAKSEFAPGLQQLEIAGERISIMLTGAEAARAFHVSRWNHDCRFTIK